MPTNEQRGNIDDWPDHWPPEPEDDDYRDYLEAVGLACPEGGMHDYRREVVWDGHREYRVIRCGKCGAGEWGDEDPLDAILDT